MTGLLVCQGLSRIGSPKRPMHNHAFSVPLLNPIQDSAKKPDGLKQSASKVCHDVVRSGGPLVGLRKDLAESIRRWELHDGCD